MERHGHLDLDPGVRQRLLAASAATLDRLLQPIRTPATRQFRRRRNQSLGRNIPVRTFADWNAPPPGFTWRLTWWSTTAAPWWGSMIHSLVATDICTGWTEAVPLLAREQSLVVAGLEAIGRQLPFPVKGIDSDNDSVFINETLIKYCAERGIQFTPFAGPTARTTRPGSSRRTGPWSATSSVMTATPARWQDKPWLTCTERCDST